MKYCSKCRLIYPESREKCRCGRTLKQYEALREDTPVCVARASGFEKDRITGALTDAGVPYSETPLHEKDVNEIVTGHGNIPWELCVPYASLEKAKEVLYGIGAQVEGEALEEEPETGEEMQEKCPKENESAKENSSQWEEMSNKKRWFWRIVSMILFFLLVWGVVSATDWIMALLMGKG